jgi:hypothetical protein
MQSKDWTTPRRNNMGLRTLEMGYRRLGTILEKRRNYDGRRPALAVGEE